MSRGDVPQCPYLHNVTVEFYQGRPRLSTQNLVFSDSIAFLSIIYCPQTPHTNKPDKPLEFAPSSAIIAALYRYTSYSPSLPRND